MARISARFHRWTRLAMAAMAWVMLLAATPVVPLRADERTSPWTLDKWLEIALKMRFEGGCASMQNDPNAGQRSWLASSLPVSVPLYENYCTAGGMRSNLIGFGFTESEALRDSLQLARMDRQEFLGFFERKVMMNLDADSQAIIGYWLFLNELERSDLISEVDLGLKDIESR